jgi:hypothetical protein
LPAREWPLARRTRECGRSVDTIPIDATLPFSVPEEDGDAVSTLTAAYTANESAEDLQDMLLQAAGLEKSQPPRFVRLPRICA